MRHDRAARIAEDDLPLGLGARLWTSLPPQPILGSIGMRVIAIWIFLRLVLVVSLMMAPEPVAEPVMDSLLLSAGIGALVIGVVFVDMLRRSELLFLANLGRPFRAVALLAFAETAVLEALLSLVVG